MAKSLHLLRGNFIKFTLFFIGSFLFLTTGWAQANQTAYSDAGLANPTVTSDKDDYAPGEIAIITGTGWNLDQMVDVHFEETPAFHKEHQHDFHGIAIDADGNWRIEYPIEWRHLGVAFEVHVVGKQTGFEAYHHFTDGVTITGPSSACLKSAISYTTNITNPTPNDGTYQWRKNNANIPGATLNTLNLNNISTVDNGTYDVVYTWITTNAKGESKTNQLASNAITLTVNSTPATPGTIIGSATVCPTTIGRTYSIDAVSGATSYTWNVPTGWVITAGQGTTSITATSGTAEGNITVTAGNTCGTSSASSLAVTVTEATGITTGPSTTTTCAGSTVIFNVTATGTSPTYQWQTASATSSFSNISGANSATLQLTNVGTGINGHRYQVIVTGCNVSVTSEPASLFVNPTSVGGTVNGTATVCSGANGTLTLSGHTGSVVRWESSIDNGTIWAAISNTTTSQSYANITTTTQYRVVVKSGLCDEAISSVATITVSPATVGGTLSPDQAICTGSTPADITLSGSVGTIVKWQRSTSSTFPTGSSTSDITNTTTTLSGASIGALSVKTYFRAFVKSGVCAELTSTVHTVDINPLPQGSFSGATICPSVQGGLTFTSTAGTGPFTVVYSAGGINYTANNVISGTPFNVQVNPTSTTAYTLVSVTGQFCPRTSGFTGGSANITVTAATNIIAQPQSATVCTGTNATLSVTASGTAPVSYQWQVKAGSADWANVTGANGSNLTISSATTSMSGNQYRVIVTGGCGDPVTSDAATLTVTIATEITQTPEDVTTCAGNNVTFTAAATGTAPVNYQWQSASATSSFSNISGATSATLTLNSVTTGMSGNRYRVVVTGGCGAAVTSNHASLLISPASVGGTLNGTATVCTGVSGSVSLSGHTGIVVRWESSTDGTNWTAITPNNTTTTQSYSNIKATTRYRAFVKSGNCDEIVSSVATITVSPATVAGSIPAQTICSGTPPADLVLANHIGDVTKWMRSTDPGFPNGVSTTTINNTTNTLSGASIGNLSVTTYFRAYVKSGACAESFASVTITVSQTRNVYIVTGGGAYCSGGTGVQVGLSGSDMGINYQLRNGSTNVSSPVAGTGEAISFGNQTVATTYTVVTTRSCATTMSGNAVVTIDTPPTTANAGTEQTVNGTSTTLAGNTPATGNTGTWSIISGTGGAIANTASPTSTFSGTAGTTYKLRWTITKSGTCPPSTSDVTITFNQITTSITTTSPTTTYGSTSVILSATVTPNPGSGTVDFYVGSNPTKVGSGTIDASTGVATYTYNPSALSASTYAIKANFLGSGYYTTSTTDPGNNGTLTVIPATPAVTVTPIGNYTFISGTAQGPDVATNSGTGTSYSFSYASADGTTYPASATKPTNAGSYTVTATVAASADGNYASASSTATAFTIGKATATLALGSLTATYDGTAKSATASTTPTGLTGVSISGGTGTNAGSYPATASLVNDNYTASDVSGNLVIDKAASVTTVTIAPGMFTYTESAITPATVRVTGAGGVELLTPAPVYSNNTNAGTANASYSYAESANHLASSGSEDFTIGKAASVTTVTIAPGTFTYTGSAIAPATASFSYSGGDNYLASLDSKTFAIGKAATTTVVTLATGPFTYTGSAITPATVSVTGAGGLNLVPIATYANNTNAGTANASYSYAESANHLASSGSEDFTIGKAASVTTVTIAPGTFTYTGSAITPATVRVTGAGGVELLTPAPVYSNSTNAGTANASYSYAESANHLASSGSEDFTIGKAILTVIAKNQFKYCGQTITFLGTEFTPVGLVNGDAITSANIVSNGSAPTASATSLPYVINISGAIGTGLSNYNITYVPGELFVKSVSLDLTSAQNPRSINEDVIIKIGVKDGEKAVSGVLVTLNVGSNVYFATSLIDGIATFILPTRLLAGLYAVTAQAGGCSVSEAVFLPIYDPNGGFVTGGGWIESLEGASKLFPLAVGRANFGFNAKYKTGKNNTSEVDGHTNFQFKAGDLHFSSLLHHNLSLVVSGAKATYTGEGTINGIGSYEFRLIAVDGDLIGSTTKDKFRIKIWTKGNPSDVVYDNERGASESADASTEIAGGSIMIHKPKANSKIAETTQIVTVEKPNVELTAQPVSLDILGNLAVAPNPVKTEAKVRFSLIEDAGVNVRLYDFNGREIYNLYSGNAKANEVYEVGFQRNNLMSGVYIIKLTTDRGNSYNKQVIIE